MYGQAAMACMLSAVASHCLLFPVVPPRVSLSGFHPASCVSFSTSLPFPEGWPNEIGAEVQLLTIILVAAVDASGKSIILRHFWRDAFPGISS